MGKVGELGLGIYWYEYCRAGLSMEGILGRLPWAKDEAGLEGICLVGYMEFGLDH